MHIKPNSQNISKWVVSALSLAVIAACGGGGDSAGTPDANVSDANVSGANADTMSQVEAVKYEWKKVAGEGQTFNLTTLTYVRYGTGTKWITKRLKGNISCSNQTFGADPAPNEWKECQTKVVVAPPQQEQGPYPMPMGTWKKVATANQVFNLTGVQMVRYGSAPNWMYRQDSGSVTCNNTYYGYWGPIPITECHVFVPSAQSGPTPAPGGGPLIDVAKIPAFNAGLSDDRVRYTGEMPPPAGDGVGAFRTGCDYSHMAFDDPIVKPNQPGASHLHVFFGNRGTNAYSTAASIATTGNSTCRGGTVNRTAYWAPAVIDTRDGTPLAPLFGSFYYKTGYAGIRPADVKVLPQGLRMVAGDPMNAQPSGPYSFKCVNGGENLGEQRQILNCPINSELWFNLTFPQCWDGVNLDSPDHKSHMSYPVNGSCPKTHPVAVPEISMHIGYVVKEANAPLRWRLSSDSYDKALPAGYSAHGDWFNGWKAEALQSFVKNCDVAAKDCHSHLLGDGREIYID